MYTYNHFLFLFFLSISSISARFMRFVVAIVILCCMVIGYGIATPIGSPWRDKISLAILELQEKGEIQMLYDKWWKLPKDSCSTDHVKQSTKANALGVNNIGGVFVVLLCGLAFAVLIAILEFCHSKRPQSHLSYIDNIGLASYFISTFIMSFSFNRIYFPDKFAAI